MKAVLAKSLTGPDDLIYEEHSIEKPSYGRVLIQAKYAGVNFPDILITQGKYQFQPDLPFSPGGEVAGIIKEVGEGVTQFKPGDRVVSGTTWGGFAEEVLGYELNTHHLPKEVALKDAASILMTHGTVIHALIDRAKLQKRETLFVLGASGGVGTAAIQIGKILGAKVVALTSTEDKAKYCVKIGADEAHTYQLEDLKEKIKSITKGNGANVIFDPIGGDFSEQAFRGIAPKGRYLVIGFASGKVPAIPSNLPLLKSAAIVGVFWGSFFRNFPQENKDNIMQLMKWVKNGKLVPMVDKIFPLEETSKALKKLQNRKVKGKVLIEI
ncbi:MAG: NADPH:quinone oxidoreductase family protein [Bacteroidota bacterium]